MKYEKITEDEKGAYENKPLIKEKVPASYEHKATVIGSTQRAPITKRVLMPHR